MFGRLKSIAAGAIKSHDQRAIDVAEALGFAVDVRAPTIEMDTIFYDEGMARMRYGGMGALEQLYKEEFKTKRRVLSGRRAYAILDDIAGELVSSDMSASHAEGLLPEYRDQWHEAGKSAFASAMLAQMFFNAGYAYRGYSDARSVSQKGWDMLANYSEKAHDVLLDSASTADACPLWHRTLLSIGLSDGATPDQLRDRFERARAFDPTDIDVYWTRAYQLIPRWHGSHEELEEFARESIAATRHELGASIYARIYCCVRETEHIPETDVDWQTLKLSFEDWLKLVDCQRVVNLYANMADLHGDSRTLRMIFDNRMTEFHPCRWQSARQAADAMERRLR